MDRSRYPVRRRSLRDEGRETRIHADAATLLAMLQELTVEAWTFKDGRWNEPRLRRDVVRVVRGRR